MISFNKLKWVLSFLLIFLLIIATNLIDKDNFKRIEGSIISIYEDRLIAKNLIVELLTLLHKKEIAVAVSDDDFFGAENKRVNQKIGILVDKFLTTKLTKQEASVFGILQEDLAQLIMMEASAELDKIPYAEKLSDVKNNLQVLSKIQLVEGENQMLLGKEVLEEIELFTRMEIYFLIFLGIVLQVIILYRPKES